MLLPCESIIRFCITLEECRHFAVSVAAERIGQLVTLACLHGHRAVLCLHAPVICAYLRCHYGQVIGINTAIRANAQGIGFAIPIDDVEPLINDLIDYGYVTGAYMAVTVQDMDKEAADMYGLPTGAYIVTVEKDGAAERAGIQPKDIVIGLDDQEVSNVTELTRTLRNYKAGDTATVKLIRSGKEMTLEITFDERPQQTEETAPQPQSPMPNEGNYDEWFDYFRRYFGG